MLKPVRVLGFVFATWAASSLLAQSPAPLTLADCVNLALSAQSAASVARQETEIARYGVAVARSAFFPQLAVGSGYTYNSALTNRDPQTGSLATNGAFAALNGTREYQTIGTSAIEIDTSGKLRAAYARAKADQRVANGNFQVAQRDLRRLVTTAFFRLLLTRHLVESADSILTEASSFEQRARQLFEGGEVAQADVVKAVSQVAFLQQTLSQAQIDADVANFELAAFWTTNVDQRLSVADTLTTQPAPPEVAQLQTGPDSYLRRPEFNVLAAQRQGFEADFRAARAQRLPQFGINLQYGIDSTSFTFRDRGSAVLFNLAIPVFDFFRARSLEQQAKLREAQVDANRSISSRNFSRDYQSAVTRVRLLYQQIALTETQVKTSEDNLRLARLRYEGGEGPALDVVAAQQQLSQARTNYYTVLANYANARADLEVAAGQ